MTPLDTALINAWQTHVLPRLATSVGRAELAHRLTTPPDNHPTPTRLAGDAQRPASPNVNSGNTSEGVPWSQTLHRTVRQLRPQNPTPQYERFEWHCPDCDQLAQRLYWPFRPPTLPAYLKFDFNQLAPELSADHIQYLQFQFRNQTQPFTPCFTCRACLKNQFGGRGLTYESTEFTSHNGRGINKNTWHLFIQRLTMGLLRGDEVSPPTTSPV